MLILVTVLACLWPGKRARPADCKRVPEENGSRKGLPGWLRWGVLLACWGSLLAYCVKSGMVTGARLISPYYPLLLPLLLLFGRQEELTRRRWWRLLVWGVLLLALPVVILTPARPLWPARTILSRLRVSHPGSHAIERALNVYTVYAERPDPLAAVRALLPQDLTTVGFLADGDDIDISFWRPLFTRRVAHVLLGDSADAIRQRQIQYIVVGGAYLDSEHATLAEWMDRVGADLVGQTVAILKVTEGPQPWYVVRLRPRS
jgi:hypothetical protein